MKLEKSKMKQSGLHYFMLGLLCFGGLGCDALVMVIDYWLYGAGALDSFWSLEWYQVIIHWTIVVFIWICVIIYVYRTLKKEGDIESVFKYNIEKKSWFQIIFAVLASFIMSWLENKIDPGMFPQIYNEFLSFNKHFDNKAIYVSIAQNIYYIVEVCLVVLLLACMQRAGEKWFKKENIPLGSLGLALTWGIGHITHGGLAALWVMFFSLIAGVIFLLCKKNVWALFIFILLVFLI